MIAILAEIARRCGIPILLACTALPLSGCMGGAIAQQLASSMLMQGADNIMHNAYEAQQREALNKRVLKDSSPDEYWISFVSSGFQPISPSEEPLPAEMVPAEQAEAEVSPFVRVEVWNLLIGDEKMSVLEQAYTRGEAELPPKNEWAGLRVATGGLEGGQGQAIIFLVPPEIGRLNSGQLAIVELGNDGQPNIARYLAR
ncbi:hypothetical protein MTYP_02319 [Methylophilaceae bacterium]|nr:hypothetical protein MTYP_02319 [Methylophilaceae bacterium]